MYLGHSVSANVYISDGYHNADRRGGDAYTRDAELNWLRCDYVGISAVLTSLLWLWSANVCWGCGLRGVALASGVATFAIAAIARWVVPRKSGHLACKLIMAVQFVGLLGYLVSLLAVWAPVACERNGAIFWIYAPGLLLYVRALHCPPILPNGFETCALPHQHYPAYPGSWPPPTSSTSLISPGVVPI